MKLIIQATLIYLYLFLLSEKVFSQTFYMPIGTVDHDLLNRLEIKSSLLQSNFNFFSPVRLYNRRQVTKQVELLDSIVKTASLELFDLSSVDRYNIERFLMNNTQWIKTREVPISKKTLWKELYKSASNLYQVDTTGLFLAINPLLQYQQSYEKGNSQSIFYNSRGISIRGLIDDKIGFDFSVTDNQEREPLYVQQWIQEHRAIPGAGYLKPFKLTGVDYFDARGSVSFNVAKYVDVQFGYGKNFIGSGYRSLFLSDFSNSTLFLKINATIGKFSYENLLMELVIPYSSNSVWARKYFSMNHLGVNVSSWLNVGLFDAIVYGAKDKFNVTYVIPVLSGKANNNSFVGLEAKANVLKKFQLYEQLLVDKVKLSEVRKNFWSNRYGYQLGIKYVDAFSIKNFDLQLESNRVRPFTYSYSDSVATYTHYNQPLAHPLEANFQEVVAIAKFQPTKNLYLQAKLIHYYKGLDSLGKNFGGNIFRDYTTRGQDYGFYVGSGDKTNCTNASVLASYEVKTNVFIDVSGQLRSYKKMSGIKDNTLVLSLGIRWNMTRREFNF